MKNKKAPDATEEDAQYMSSLMDVPEDMEADSVAAALAEEDESEGGHINYNNLKLLYFMCPPSSSSTSPNYNSKASEQYVSSIFRYPKFVFYFRRRPWKRSRVSFGLCA